VNDGYRDTFTYGENGNTLSLLSEQWTNNQWVNVGRYAYTYDPDGKGYSYVYEYWANGQWVIGSRWTFIFDNHGNWVSGLVERWYNNQWVNSSRYTLTYDDNGRRLSVLDEEWLDGQWENWDRDTYTYDAQGNLLTQLSEEWVSGQWVNYTRCRSTYNTHGNMTSGSWEVWVNSKWNPFDGPFTVVDGAMNQHQYTQASYITLHYSVLITEVALKAEPGPVMYALSQNYPNPFNPSTTIKYKLPKSSVVRLSVFDMLGREVSVLLNERRDAGVYEVKFDGSSLASGVYFYRLQAGDFVQAKGLVITK
jgi:hypothetical protein